MAQLEVITEQAYGRKYKVGSVCLLGRDPSCHVNDLFQDDTVSRQHARVEDCDGRYYVTDEGSKNGTYLNGERIVERTPLCEGDKLKICHFEFRFSEHITSERKSGSSGGDSAVAKTHFVDQEHDSSLIENSIDASLSTRKLTVAVTAPGAPARLRAVLEMLAKLSRSLDLSDVLDGLLAALLKIFPQADRAFIGVKLEDDGPLVPARVKHRNEDCEESVRVSRAIAERVMTKRQAILSTDPTDDFPGSESVRRLKMRSVMCAPLLDGDNTPLGFVQIETDNRKKKFCDEDLVLLASVAPQAAFALKHAQLHQRAMEAQAVQRDLRFAHRVQHALLPSEDPTIDGYDFYSFYRPAFQVGGDYYDYVLLPDGRLALVVADVSSKGVPAALWVAKLTGEIKYALAAEKTPAAAVVRLNRSLAESSVDARFVTFLMTVLDPQSHRVTVVNAGHHPPLMRRADGRMETFSEEFSSLPLGVVTPQDYEEFVIELGAGDSLTLYTDGVIDALNAEGERYDESRLLEQIIPPVLDMDDLGRRIVEDVNRHMGGHEQVDDMCLVCFCRC